MLTLHRINQIRHLIRLHFQEVPPLEFHHYRACEMAGRDYPLGRHVLITPRDEICLARVDAEDGDWTPAEWDALLSSRKAFLAACRVEGIPLARVPDRSVRRRRRLSLWHRIWTSGP